MPGREAEMLSEEYLAKWNATPRRLSDEGARAVVLEALAALPPSDAAEFMSRIDVIPSVWEFDPAQATQQAEFGLRVAFTAERDPSGRAFGSIGGHDDEEFEKFRAEVGGRNYYRVPGSQYWIKWSDIKGHKVAVLVGLALAALTFSPPIGVAAGSLTSIFNSVKRLSDEELEIFLIMMRLTDGDVYNRYLTTDELLAAIPDDRGEKHNRELLATMRERGFLTESAGVWRAKR